MTTVRGIEGKASTRHGCALVALLLVGGSLGACTRANPDYSGAGGTQVCTPACLPTEYCVQGIRCIPYDAGVVPDIGIIGEDVPGPGQDPIVPDQGAGEDRPDPPRDRPDPPPPPPPDMPQPQKCEPNKDFCLDDSTQARCNDAGTGVAEERPCGDNEFCDPDLGQCTNNGPGMCTPGESRCTSDESVERCLDDGTTFGAEDCAPSFSCSRVGGEPNCYLARGCQPAGGFGCIDQFLVHCVEGDFLEQIHDCNLVENASCEQQAEFTCCFSNTGTSICCEDGGGCFEL